MSLNWDLFVILVSAIIRRSIRHKKSCFLLQESAASSINEVLQKPYRVFKYTPFQSETLGIVLAAGFPSAAAPAPQARPGHRPEGRSFRKALDLSFLHEIPQYAVVRCMPQLIQGFGLNLADSFASDGKTPADFLQRMLAAALQTEAHFEHVLLAWRQGF